MSAARVAGLLAIAALACGAAAAQGGAPADGGAVCRSFCDADAQTCRKDADRRVDEEHRVLLPLLSGGVGGAYGGSYDFSAEKRELADKRESEERFQASRTCGQARQACRQKCTPAPAPAASAPT